MKKYMMLAGLLIAFNLVVAGEVGEVGEVIGVNVTVVKPLSLEVKHVEFGLLPQGTTKNVPDSGKGRVSISGENSRWVNLSLVDSDNPDTNILERGEASILLRRESNPGASLTADKTVTYNLSTEEGTRKQLDSTGKLDIVLAGSATAGELTESGNYGKVLTFKVAYDFESQDVGN